MYKATKIIQAKHLLSFIIKEVYIQLKISNSSFLKSITMLIHLYQLNAIKSFLKTSTLKGTRFLCFTMRSYCNNFGIKEPDLLASYI